MAKKDDAEISETDRRIKDATSAREVYKKFFKANETRAKTMVQTRNQLEGGRPMDPATLERNGEAHRTNINFRDSEAAFNRTYLPYWKMVHDVPNKIAPSVQSSAPDSDKWGKAIAESFDLFLDDWGSDYFFQFMLFTYDFVKFGPGYVQWSDADSPRFEHARTEFVLLPKRAKANINSWEIVTIEGEMTVSDLWAKIRTKKQVSRSEYVGWNVKAVKAAIKLARQNSGQQTGSDDWARIQDEIVSNDLRMCEEWAPLPIVRMFVRDFSGKICCYVFTKDEGVKDFLFETDEYADEMKHAIAGIFYDVGVNGLVHSIKGFALKNYHLAMLTNRVKSRIIDSATMALSMNFIETEDLPDEAPPVQNYGGVNVFPKGLTQIGVYPQLQQGMAVTDLLERNAAENNYIYRESRQEIADSQTARQATILANLAEEIGTATASLYLSQIGESIFAECYRRLIRPSDDVDAAKFKKRLNERGVPLKVIAQLGATEDKRIDVTIKTGANPGTAGAALRDMIMKELLGMINMPGVNRRWIQEQYIANKLGSQAVGKALLPEGVDSEPAQRRLAMMENSNFGQALPLPVDPSDAHYAHADEHLKPLEAIIGMFKQRQQINPEQVVALQVSLPHVEQHLSYLKQDDTQKDAYKDAWARFSNTASVTVGIMAKLRKSQQQQQQQQPQPV